MEDLASPAVLSGPSHVAHWHPPSERLSRKSGTHDIFQGMDLRQLRRLFQVAGEQDAEQRAQMVWRGSKGRRTMGQRQGEGEEESGADQAEVDVALAQALVGLRVRARTRSGIRAEGLRDANRRLRSAPQHRSCYANTATAQPPLELEAEDGASEDGQDQTAVAATKSDGEMLHDFSDGTSSRRARDPDRHLHGVRH